MQELQHPMHCGFAANAAQNSQQYSQGIYYPSNRVYPQDPRYCQHHEYFRDPQGRPGPPSDSPPRIYHPIVGTHASMKQTTEPTFHQDAYYPSPYHQHPFIPAMGPVTSTVEKPYAGSQRPCSVTQQKPLQDYVSPPAYSRDEYQQFSPSPSLYSRTASRSELVSRPTGSMGELADGYKLVAIPATSSQLGSPFLRAYPPALENYGISRQTFIQFIDRLNRATVASPPIQVLGLAGNIVGFVPLHTTQIVGGAVNFAAKVSTVAVSKGRSEMLLKEANNTLFKAAGLKAQVARLDVVAKLGKIPILDAEGKVNKNSSILLPFEQNQDPHLMNAQERRVQALSPWLSPLDVESLPELDESANMLGKIHAKVSERQREKEEKKMIKDRMKMHKDYTKDRAKEDMEYEEKMREYAAKQRKLEEERGRRMENGLRELEKKREKLTKEHNKEVSKIEKDRRKDDKEEESMRKILFLVIQRA